MCKRILKRKASYERGTFFKGNEPGLMLMPIIAAPCRCGKIWARVETGKEWVECVRQSAPTREPHGDPPICDPGV